MKKLIMLSLLLPFFSVAMQIEQKNLQVPGRLSGISVFKTKAGFQVEEPDYTRVEVPSHKVNKDLRKMNMRQLAKFTKAGYIAVNQSDDGQYSLDAVQRLRGGGAWGMWLGSTLGYGGITAACYGTLYGVSWLTGPAQPVVFLTLSTMCKIPIHYAACTGGIAGGIALGVATGPV